MACGRGGVGVPQNIMRALCAVVRPDQFKFASYGPDKHSDNYLSIIHLIINMKSVKTNKVLIFSQVV